MNGFHHIWSRIARLQLKSLLWEHLTVISLGLVDGLLLMESCNTAKTVFGIV